MEHQLKLAFAEDARPENVERNAEIDAVLQKAHAIVISSSAGKDSQCCLQVVADTVKRLKIPRERVVVVHADLMDMEWPGVPELAEEQARHYGFRFEVVRRTLKDGTPETLLEYARRRGMWPSFRARWCTSELKRAPIRKIFTRLARESGAKPATLVHVMGLRAEESPSRARKNPWIFDESASSGRREVFQWLPVFRWSTERVWEEIRKSGVRHHPIYEKGLPRLSCSLCVLASRSALIKAGRLAPELLNRYVEAEAEMGHQFRQDFSILEIQRAIQTGEQADTVENWAA